MSAMSRVEAAKLLGLELSATETDVKAAFKKLSKLHHPDVGGDEETFKKLGQARDILLEKPSWAGGPEPSGRWYTGDATDPYEGWKSAWNEPKFKFTRHTVTVTASEAFSGVTKTLLNARTGEKLDVEVPKGVSDDTVIQLRTGEIISIFIRDETFKIDFTFTQSFATVNADLAVPLVTMLGGGKVEAKLIDGATIRLHVPAGSAANSFLKVRGRGYWKNPGQSDLRGDCLLRMIPIIKPLKDFTTVELTDLTTILGDEIDGRDSFGLN